MIFLLNLTYSFAVTFKYKSAVSSPDHVVPEVLAGQVLREWVGAIF